MTATLHLDDLYDVWVNGGSLGNATTIDGDNKTVSWDMQQPLRLENILLDPDEKYAVILEFTLKSGVSAPFEIKNQMVYFRQLTEETVEIDNGDGTSFEITRDKVYGSVNYAMSILDDAGTDKKGKTNNVDNMGHNESWFEIYPNPANQRLTLSISNSYDASYRVTVTDISGKTIFDDERAVFNSGLYHINTSGYIPGVYHVTLIDKANKTQVKKFVKVE